MKYLRPNIRFPPQNWPFLWNELSSRTQLIMYPLLVIPAGSLLICSAPPVGPLAVASSIVDKFICVLVPPLNRYTPFGVFGDLRSSLWAVRRFHDNHLPQNPCFQCSKAVPGSDTAEHKVKLLQCFADCFFCVSTQKDL